MCACVNVSTVLSNECRLPEHRKQVPMSLNTHTHIQLHTAKPHAHTRRHFEGYVLKRGHKYERKRNKRERQRGRRGCREIERETKRGSDGEERYRERKKREVEERGKERGEEERQRERERERPLSL